MAVLTNEIKPIFCCENYEYLFSPGEVLGTLTVLFQRERRWYLRRWYLSMESPQPFTATEIWKSVVLNFRKGMSLKKRRLGRRGSTGCFTGPEAIAWLHSHLTTSPVIKNSVTQEQVVVLLQKFLEANVIREEVENSTRTPPCMDSEKSLFSFVTSPGPFNFLDDSTLSSSSLAPNTSTILSTSFCHSSSPSTLGKRKRHEVGVAVSVPAHEGLMIANDFASSSADVEESSFGDTNSVDMMSFLEEVEGALGVTTTCSPPKRFRQGDVDVDVPYQKLGDHNGGTGEEKENEMQVNLEEIWRELVLSRLLLLVDLPTLEGVLTQQSVSGRVIAGNVSRLVGVACKVGGICSSVAQTCLAALENVGVASRHDNSAAADPLPAAAYIDPRGSGCGRGARRWMRKVARRCAGGGAMEEWPEWVTMAMKCLPSWPDGCTPEFLGDLPVYQGFELDIWQSILSRLKEEPESIISHAHYSLYMEVLKLVKNGHPNSLEACRLCLLLLPPERHGNLQHLLKFIHGASCNKNLQLITNVSHQCNRKLLLEELSPVVLRRTSGCGLSEEDLEEVKVLLSYMVKNRESIFQVPEGLVEEVQGRADKLKEGLESPQDLGRVVCQRVSMLDYKAGGEKEAEVALKELLQQIVDDTKSSNAQKKKRLKKFQKAYPKIFEEKFGEESDPLLMGRSRRKFHVGGSLLKKSIGYLRTRK